MRASSGIQIDTRGPTTCESLSAAEARESVMLTHCHVRRIGRWIGRKEEIVLRIWGVGVD